MRFVTKSQLPTLAALNELAFASPDPTDGIFTRFDLRSFHDTEGETLSMLTKSFIDTALSLNKECPHRPNYHGTIRSANTFPKPLDRTPGLLRCVHLFRYKGNKQNRHYSDEPPLSWTSHSHGIQLEGPALGKLANFRSLSLADETKIPGPAVPVGRSQLHPPYSDWIVGLQGNAFHISMTTGKSRDSPTIQFLSRRCVAVTDYLSDHEV